MNLKRRITMCLRLGATAMLFLFIFTASLTQAQTVPLGFESGDIIFYDDDGEREEIFTRITSVFACPTGSASAAPDEDTWLTVDSPTLEGTNAKAAIIFGHAFANQDGTGEENGIATFVSKDGLSTPSPLNQLAHSLVFLGGESADEHGIMVVDLDTNKDFKVLYRFGRINGPATDETQMCAWGTRIQLVGWIEDGSLFPNVTTLPATEVTDTSATLNGSVSGKFIYNGMDQEF